MSSMISALNNSPLALKKSIAASLAITLRCTGNASATIFAISASIAARSSGVNARSKAKS